MLFCPYDCVSGCHTLCFVIECVIRSCNAYAIDTCIKSNFLKCTSDSLTYLISLFLAAELDGLDLILLPLLYSYNRKTIANRF